MKTGGESMAVWETLAMAAIGAFLGYMAFGTYWHGALFGFLAFAIMAAGNRVVWEMEQEKLKRR
jgi:membrane protein implicated in regulation of membrane protease activity